MGVKGLWPILAPGGRRIKLESLEGKILAIDASIWVIQFVYAIKQGKIGNSTSMAHLHGFMRRICKLLYFGIKPVFVFDGKTPALKKRTLVKRKNMQLQRQQIDFKKAAERLIKKYLDINLRNVRENEKRSGRSDFDEVKILSSEQQNIKDTVARIAHHESEKEIEKMQDEEDNYENEIIQSLIIEYGMLLEQNDIEIEEFAKLEHDQKYGLISHLKNMKQQSEFNKLAKKKGDLAAFSKFSIKSYIESVNEKQNLKKYRIKASNEYKKLSNFQNKKKEQVYEKEFTEKPKLPAIFNKPLKKRKRKVDNMIMELDRQHQEELRANTTQLHPCLSDMETIMLNPVEIFEKLELANKMNQQQAAKETKKSEVGSEQRLKEEANALWSDEDIPKSNANDEDDPFADASEGSADKNDPFDFENFQENTKKVGDQAMNDQNIDESDELESLVVPKKQLSTHKQIADTSPTQKQNPKDKIEVMEEDKEVDIEPVNDYYKNKNQLLRIFQKKKPKKRKFARVRKQQKLVKDPQNPSVEPDQEQRMIARSKADSLSSMQTTTKSIRLPNVLTQAPRQTAESSNTRCFTTQDAKEESKSDRNDELEQYLSSDSEKGTEKKTNDIFKDFDEIDLEGYDAEEVRENMEINKIANIQTGDNDDQGCVLFSEEMLADIKKLLYTFGIPYIEAPFEAESQCAYLEMQGKVDGVVTQDSDVFLFGSRNVYKDIFDQNKFVEYYKMHTIETELGFDRDALISMALLLGSDYTIGVKGIGPVNATEIVQAFYD